MRNSPKIAVFVSLLLIAAAAAAQDTVSEQTDVTSPRGQYRIGVEDRLYVSVWREAELSGSSTVRPDGMVTVPLIGDVLAEGRTPESLAEELTDALGRFVKDPIVTVKVEEINHFKVYIIGEVSGQGVLQLKRPTRFLQAIAQVGGLTAFADKSNLVLVRYDDDGRESRTRIDYKKVLNGQKSDMNVLLQPGDTIIVK